MIDWKTKAACSYSDVDLFFPEDELLDSGEAAKAICAGCPVSEECLEYALDGNEKYGIWGGTTSIERRRIRRARNKVQKSDP